MLFGEELQCILRAVTLDGGLEAQRLVGERQTLIEEDAADTILNGGHGDDDREW